MARGSERSKANYADDTGYIQIAAAKLDEANHGTTVNNIILKGQKVTTGRIGIRNQTHLRELRTKKICKKIRMRILERKDRC